MELTCVSGYWNVKNKHNNKFNDWFENTLRINCPYVFFADAKTIEIIKKYRRGLPTHYIECKLQDFYTFKYKDKMKTDPRHCPSVKLNLIWNEKIFFVEKVKNINPFNSKYFMWIDAGICTFRTKKPPSEQFPNINKLNKLPKDKFIYSASTKYNEYFVKINNYYHHISGTYILHINIIDYFTNLYKEYLDKLIDENNIWTDQVIWTFIFKDNKDKFFKLCNGYGTIINNLF